VTRRAMPQQDGADLFKAAILRHRYRRSRGAGGVLESRLFLRPILWPITTPTQPANAAITATISGTKGSSGSTPMLVTVRANGGVCSEPAVAHTSTTFARKVAPAGCYWHVSAPVSEAARDFPS
jgi:hypothetical protein